MMKNYICDKILDNAWNVVNRHVETKIADQVWREIWSQLISNQIDLQISDQLIKW